MESLLRLAFGNKDIDLILQKCEESDILNKALKPHIMGVDLLDLGFTLVVILKYFEFLQWIYK